MAEKLKGGLADGKKKSDYSAEQMKMGREVEYEHTDDPEVSDEIAMDHLEEIPDYYTRLYKMEKQAEREMNEDKMWEQVISGEEIEPFEDRLRRRVEETTEVKTNKGAFSPGIGPHWKAKKAKKSQGDWYASNKVFAKDQPSHYGEKGEGFS